MAFSVGNPLTDGTWTYTWQNGRQLASMSKSGTTASFKYNENGLRIQKTVNSVVTNYTLHGKNIVHMTQGSNELHFFYDASNKPAIVEYNGTKYAYVHNLQGDIVAILDSTGTKVVEYKYDAWGRPISKTGSMASTLGTVQPFRYRGYVYDEETGLYYLQTRFYCPNFLRFANSDSYIGPKDTLIAHCLYAYCYNCPVGYTDSSGMVGEISLILFSVAGLAAQKLKNVSQADHYARNEYYGEYPDTFDPQFFIGWDDSVAADCHQFSAINGRNKKYVSEDGKYEVIYNSNNQEVTDPRDIGTYNYASPNDYWGHFVEDVYPWILWGNSKEDTTTQEQRIQAFASGAGTAAPVVEEVLNLLVSFLAD